jgi:hypothetical protein
MLKSAVSYDKLKKDFESKFVRLLLLNPPFRYFLFKAFSKGAQAYIVGGFLRDIIIGKASRDLDIIIDFDHDEVLKLINEHQLIYSVNRLNGIKISLDNFNVDIWSIDQNWAFKNNLVAQNEKDILESIASGCFYNFDALVINVKSLEVNVHYFNKLVEKNKLDILRKKVIYKVKNPTIEANILRAFYLKVKYNLDYSQNCNAYLVSRIGYLEDTFGSASDRLNEFLYKYPKYQEAISNFNIKELIIHCRRSFTGQLWIDFDSGYEDMAPFD